MDNVSGLYFYLNKFRKPINVKKIADDKVYVFSSYWKSQIGTYDKDTGVIYFEKLGKCTLHEDKIVFDKVVWHRDTRKNILFVGENCMSEVKNYITEYRYGLFIEAAPDMMEKLRDNLDYANRKFFVDFRGINALVTSEAGKDYEFNVFSNNGASSSIYNPNSEAWKWPKVKVSRKIKLKSTTLTHILDKAGWENKRFDMVVDVQGAELEVLMGFKKYLGNVDKMTVETSKKEFYKGGVLFCDLDEFLKKNDFKIVNVPNKDHDDVTYIKNKDNTVK